jgi:hypothetical protein
VAVPQVIERQEAEAEAIRKAAYDVVDEAPTSETSETPAADPATVAPPAPPTPAPAPQPQPAAPVQAVPQPPVGPAEDAHYWKQRFDTLAGKFDAEVPRLHQQLREQHERMQALSAQLEQAPAAPSAPGSPALQQDIDSFGEDLVDFVRRMAHEEIAAERARIEQRFGAVAQQVEQVQGYVVKNESTNFWKEVVNLVPDWLVIDTTPAWIQWLDTSPEYTEATYRQLAAQAIEKGKPEKIAKLVETWKAVMGQAAPSSGNGSQRPTPVQPQPSLSSQVAPSTVKSGSAPVARRVLTRADYEAMYDVRNVQRLGEKEAARLIAEADAAVAEGRVQW